MLAILLMSFFETIKAGLETSDGLRLIVDFGHQQVATVDERNVVNLLE